MNSDMLAMQQEALKRVREMQEKQRASLLKSPHSKKEPPHKPQTPPAPLQEVKSAASEKPESKGNRFLKLFNFKNFDFDSDSALILLIAILLTDSKDELLLPALIYLLI